MIERVKHILGLFLILVGFIFAFQVSLHSFKGETFVNIQELIKSSNRDIANVNKLEKPKSTILISTSPLRLLSDAKLNEPPKGSMGTIEIILGHFSLPPTDNKSSLFACQLYDEVILTYEALTLASDKKGNDANPLMTIKTPCTIDTKDLLHLKAIQLVPQKITKEPPGDGMRVSEDGSYSLHFENMEDQWPTSWQFKSVQLKATKNNTPPKEMNRADLSLNEQTKLDITNWMH
jgi:hypothetical protein